MSETTKGNLALYWGASCGGCEIAVLGIDEKILDIAATFNIVFWPVAVDAKVRSIEKMEDKSIDLCLFNGAIRTSEQEYMARLLRQKTKTLIGFGSCAQEGCIPGLANVTNREEIFQTAYFDTPSTDNPKGVVPQTETEVDEGMLYLPYFYNTVKTLGQTVNVDYYIPGCPPESDDIWDALVVILEGNLPESGSVFGKRTTVCDQCDMIKTEKKITGFKRTWEVIPDGETCLLEQGILCMGIATRAICGGMCPKVNSPCIGCHGPSEDVVDIGARMITALSSVIDSDDPEEIERIIQEGIPDPVGSFYKFNLAGSLLRRSAFTGVETAESGEMAEPA